MRRTLMLLLLVGLLAASCAQEAAESSPATAPQTTPTTEPSPATEAIPPTTAATTTTTSAPPTTAATTTSTELSESVRYDYYVETEEFHDGLELDIHAPDGTGERPVVVMIHGGGWYAGSRESMGMLADGLADRGAVVFNISYSTGIRGGMFPGAVDDVACGVAHAAATADRFTTTSGRLFVVGHSAGAHMGSLVALDSDGFGTSCAHPVPQVDGFVGLAGPYNVELLEFVLKPWFGVGTEEDPALWARANPLLYAEEAPDIPFLLIHGEVDQVAPVAFSEQFSDSLHSAGADVRFEVITDAGHSEVSDPRVVGDLIAGLWSDQ